jgi:hypothetical protein
MAFDAARGRIVLNAGIGEPDLGTRFVDTWEWDGARWHEMATEGPLLEKLVFDPRRGAVLGFAVTPGGTETYRWDGTRWSLLVAASGPASVPAAVYDMSRGVVVVFGAGETWELDAAWQQAPIGAAGEPTSATGAYDARRHAIVAISDDGPNGTQWLRKQGMWSQLAPAPVPDLSASVPAYDAPTGELLVLSQNDTLAWNGSSWHVARANTATGAGSPPVLVSTPTGVMRIGSAQTRPGYQNVARWSAGTWEVIGPPFASTETFAVDPTGRVLGYELAQLAPQPGTTWRFDGAFGIIPVASPDSLSSPDLLMQYGVAQDRTMLITSNLDEAHIWSWDGATWMEITPPSMPAIRSGSLSYDVALGRFVLLQTDHWEWDGKTWTPLAGTTPVETFHPGAATYDPASRATVISDRVNGPNDRTWTQAWDSLDPDEECSSGFDVDRDGLVGCADPDCWHACTPSCPPHAAQCDPAAPHCGDGVCSPLENCRLCPGDCGACPVVCGDLFCDGGESPATCPGDCH